MKHFKVTHLYNSTTAAGQLYSVFFEIINLFKGWQLKTIKSLLFILFIPFILGCKKSDSTSNNSNNNNGNGNTTGVITVTTQPVTNIKIISAVANGKVEADIAKTTITAKGVVWSTSQNPVISLATKTEESATPEAFQSQISDLQYSTTYYLRAYAIDNKGNTVYGNEVSFTTNAGWRTVSAGTFFSVGIKTDGTLWAWGDNTLGQLGDGSTVLRSTPFQIGTDTNWKEAAVGGYNSENSGSLQGPYILAIKKDGTLWGWGSNKLGQLADGTYLSRYVPTRIGTNTNWTAIAPGTGLTVGLQADGTVSKWGFFDVTIASNYINSPLVETTISQVSKISSGFLHYLLIKADGTLWGYGYNYSGQLGDGTSMNNTTQKLKKIGTSSDWVKINCGNSSSFGIKADGSLWAWGSNGGTLGDGSNADRYIPTQISSATKVTDVSSSRGLGSGQTLILKSDGTLWGTGNGTQGQLGDGTQGQRFSFAQIGNVNTWVAIATGTSYSLAIQKNGSLWSSGQNIRGSLGLGENVDGEIKPTFTLVE
jgi:alpha-tubulin suppressor-like RCC1 family protein